MSYNRRYEGAQNTLSLASGIMDAYERATTMQANILQHESQIGLATAQLGMQQLDQKMRMQDYGLAKEKEYFTASVNYNADIFKQQSALNEADLRIAEAKQQNKTPDEVAALEKQKQSISAFASNYQKAWEGSPYGQRDKKQPAPIASASSLPAQAQAKPTTPASGPFSDVFNGSINYRATPEYIDNRPAYPGWKSNFQDGRGDGTIKGYGHFGIIQTEKSSLNAEGKTVTTSIETSEYTPHFPGSELIIDGKQYLYPSLVPTLTPEEFRAMREDIIPYGKTPPAAILEKAKAYATEQIKQGKSPFKGESLHPVPTKPTSFWKKEFDQILDPAAKTILDNPRWAQAKEFSNLPKKEGGLAVFKNGILYEQKGDGSPGEALTYKDVKVSPDELKAAKDVVPKAFKDSLSRIASTKGDTVPALKEAIQTEAKVLIDEVDRKVAETNVSGATTGESYSMIRSSAYKSLVDEIKSSSLEPTRKNLLLKEINTTAQISDIKFVVRELTNTAIIEATKSGATYDANMPEPSLFKKIIAGVADGVAATLAKTAQAATIPLQVPAKMMGMSVWRPIDNAATSLGNLADAQISIQDYTHAEDESVSAMKKLMDPQMIAELRQKGTNGPMTDDELDTYLRISVRSALQSKLNYSVKDPAIKESSALYPATQVFQKMNSTVSNSPLIEAFGAVPYKATKRRYD